MGRRVVEELIVPARHGRACIVPKGHVLRIHQLEGQQAADCVFFNADRPREQFHVGQTWAYAVMLGTGTARAYRHLYSNPPHENVMLTVVGDSVRVHFGNCAGRCSRRLLERRDGRSGPDVRSCQENLAEALAAFGIAGEDIGDVFNAFMNVEFGADGGFAIRVPETRAGDYIELRAEMNVLAAVSACPNETGPVNNYRAKPLGLTILGDE